MHHPRGQMNLVMTNPYLEDASHDANYLRSCNQYLDNKIYLRKDHSDDGPSPSFATFGLGVFVIGDTNHTKSMN